MEPKALTVDWTLEVPGWLDAVMIQGGQEGMDIKRPCGTLMVDGDCPYAIAQPAGAMARAQSELEDPIKNLTAVLRTGTKRQWTDQLSLRAPFPPGSIFCAKSSHATQTEGPIRVTPEAGNPPHSARANPAQARRALFRLWYRMMLGRDHLRPSSAPRFTRGGQ
jgi:hypothetical protein